MTVLRVYDATFGDGARDQLDREANTVRRERERRLFVVTDGSIYDTCDSILLTPGLPKERDPFILMGAQDAKLRCFERTPKQLAYDFFEVVCRYDDQTPDAPPRKKPGEGDKEKEEEDPLLVPAVISWSCRDIETFDGSDVNGREQKNSAGTKFRKQLPKHVPCLVWNVQRNQEAYNPLFYVRYIKRCNASPFKRFPKWAVLCDDIRAHTETKNGVDLWVVAYTFFFLGGDPNAQTGNNNLWRPSKVLDEGPFHYDVSQASPGSTGGGQQRLVVAKDRNNVAHGRDVRLDGRGFPLQDVQPNVYLDFHMYFEADLNDLRMP